MNKFGYPITDYNTQEKCEALAADYLNNSALSLVLGAGLSIGEFNLPSWPKLVEKCATPTHVSFPTTHKPSNEELKKIAEEIKQKAGTSYKKLVKEKLYEGIDFDFQLAKRDLLVAISSMFIGRSRGYINKVLTYNFDSILEWYLTLNGLRAKVSTFENILYSNSDVEILHIHGYIPHDDRFGEASEELVFTKTEFEDRMVGDSYWKTVMLDFFRRSLFLSVGFSADSIIDDVAVYLRLLDKWYEHNKTQRNHPYGIAFLSDIDSNQKEKLIMHGIVPCVIPNDKLSEAIFNISHTAMNSILNKN